MEQVFSGQVLVETSARYEALTIEDGAVLTAPAGKFVCMTVNGVGCDPKPGRYVGDIALTLADSYPMAPHGLMRINGRGRDFQDALVVDTTAGQVVEAQCVPELVQGGTVTGEKTEGVYIASSAESFNGLVIHGDGAYTVKDSVMELDGFSANDFLGVGSAVAAIDKANVTIDGCEFNVNGVTRCAVHVGGDSRVTVKNTKIENVSPASVNMSPSCKSTSGSTGSSVMRCVMERLIRLLLSPSASFSEI